MDAEIPASERLVKMTCATLRKALASAHRYPTDPGMRMVLSTSVGAYLDEEASRSPLARVLSRLLEAGGNCLGQGCAGVIVIQRPHVRAAELMLLDVGRLRSH
jgi:hypothetical protein